MENQLFDNSCYIPYSKNFNISLVEGFFGIFLEYSIFQIFQYFLVEGLFWNIPFLRFSYSMEYSVEYENVRNGIFQKKRKQA